MKPCILIFLCVLTLLTTLSCSRELTNPLDTDSELKQNPEILQVYLDNSNRIVLQLGMSYSQAATIIFERKITNTFEPITCQKLSASTFADTTLNMELDYNLSYRIKVQKGEYQTDYSPVNNYNYVSNIINAPSGVSATSIELQGIRLNWQDNSGTESGYKIEKNENGAGYTELADLPANCNTYLHSISGMPATTLNLAYRIKTYYSGLSSAWVETTTSYSGLGAPSNLHVIDNTPYRYMIGWTRNSNIATSYEIERKLDDASFTLVNSVSSTAQTFTDNISIPGTYSYRIRAKLDAVYSTYSNTITNTISTVIPTNGLIAFYPFNGNAHDESGNGHNGIVCGSNLTADRFGIAGKAYEFDGIDDYIECPSSGNLSNAFTEMSLSAWVYVEDWYIQTDQSGWASIFCKYDSHLSFQYQIQGIAGNGFPNDFGQYYSNSAFQGTCIDYTQYNSHQWFHIAVVWGPNEVRFYRNGIITRVVQQNSSALNGSSASLLIGKDNAGPIEYHNGKLDELCIYNRSLSEAEIQALYHEGGWTGSGNRKTVRWVGINKDNQVDE